MHDHPHEHHHNNDDHSHHHEHRYEPRPLTFEDCVQFHGHSCPGLASGYRAATAALEALGIRRPEDEELVAICETDACSVDAIQVIAGTTAGKGNLVIRDYGKHAFTFYNRRNGNAVRITVQRKEEPKGRDMAALRSRVFSGKATAAEEREFHTLMHQATVRILHAPAEEIMKIERVTIAPPQRARIYASVTCAGCGESVADAKTRMAGGKQYCIPCSDKLQK